ncbi:hypothetical protein E4T43_07583 [Aureobasidium subglaciale]|nr:hypothetical protein E4T43_07583 [Aureobasidium subglaciale]
MVERLYSLSTVSMRSGRRRHCMHDGKISLSKQAIHLPVGDNTTRTACCQPSSSFRITVTSTILITASNHFPPCSWALSHPPTLNDESMATMSLSKARSYLISTQRTQGVSKRCISVPSLRV